MYNYVRKKSRLHGCMVCPTVTCSHNNQLFFMHKYMMWHCLLKNVVKFIIIYQHSCSALLVSVTQDNVGLFLWLLTSSWLKNSPVALHRTCEIFFKQVIALCTAKWKSTSAKRKEGITFQGLTAWIIGVKNAKGKENS